MSFKLLIFFVYFEKNIKHFFIFFKVILLYCIYGVLKVSEIICVSSFNYFICYRLLRKYFCYWTYILIYFKSLNDTKVIYLFYIYLYLIYYPDYCVISLRQLYIIVSGKNIKQKAYQKRKGRGTLLQMMPKKSWNDSWLCTFGCFFCNELMIISYKCQSN